MKLLSLRTAFAALALSLATAANALTITPANAIATGNNNSNQQPSEWGPLHGLGSLSLLYKAEQDGSPDSGTFAASYNTAFTNTPAEPSDATISYVGLPAPVPIAFPLYLYVKDGNQQPAYYIFDISLWNRTDDLVLQNFWPQNGAISNLAIGGGTTAGQVPPITTPGVPDGGSTVALLGAGLALLAFFRRKFLS
jgi:hypothetical protein